MNAAGSGRDESHNGDFAVVGFDECEGEDDSSLIPVLIQENPDYSHFSV